MTPPLTELPPAQTPTLRELHSQPRSAGALAHYLAAIRGVLGADALQLVRYRDGVPAVVAEATPSEEISRNLLVTAGNPPAAANGAAMVVSKFRFGAKVVHLLAAQSGEPEEWLLVWLRLPEGTPAESVAGVVELAVLGLPGGGSIATAEALRESETHRLQTGDLLPGIQPGAGSVERLNTFARWLAHRFGADDVYLLRRKAFGWQITGSAKRLPTKTGPLAHAIVHALRSGSQDSQGAAIEEVRRISGHSTVQILQWTSRHAAVIAGGENLAPDPAVQKLAGELLVLLDTSFTPIGTLRERWHASSRLRRIVTIGGFALLAGVLIMPVHQRVRSHLILEPAVRRFVAAPFDGVLKHVHVRGGDVVTEGQLLAELDEREITERLAEVEAKLSSAILQNTAEIESSNYGEAAVRSLDAAGLNHERELLRHRQANLKLLSPMRGVVVTGELERSEGATVELGRALLEIAPLESLLVEIAVDESDIALVREGMEIHLQLYALPGETFTATVQKVQLRSETRDARNVFIVEAELPNRNDILRPGMKGRAVIFADRKPLVWSLVRKPWQTVQKWVFR